MVETRLHPPPPRLTVDFGRDGKLHLEQIKTGALTFSRHYGWQGLQVYEELDTWLDEMVYIRDGARRRGLDPEKILSLVYGRPGTNAPAENGNKKNNTGKTGSGGDDDGEGEGDDTHEDPTEVAAALSHLSGKPDRALALMHHLRLTT
jgi:hypothetical protein